MQSLKEIEEAIAKLPKNVQQQLVHDIPGLCAEVFPPGGWDAVMGESAPPAGDSSLLNEMDSEYQTKHGHIPEKNKFSPSPSRARNRQGKK